jgi:hypothetical protein
VKYAITGSSETEAGSLHLIRAKKMKMDIGITNEFSRVMVFPVMMCIDNAFTNQQGNAGIISMSIR